MALSNKQKAWFYRVYEHKCYFPMYSEKRGFHACGSTFKVELHHLAPQGFVKRVLKGLFNNGNPDVPTNILPICKRQHVGYRYGGSLDHQNDLVDVIHTDAAWAYRQYSKQGKEAFNKVFSGRESFTTPYWNTDWDVAMQQIADRIVGAYLIAHPNDPFPKRRIQ